MRVTPPPHPLWDTQPLLFNKYTLSQRSSVYTKELKQLVVLAGWLIDWLRQKQTDSYILLHTALKTLVSFRGRGGGGWGVGTLMWSYISSFGPFLEFQNFEFYFVFGGGGGAEKNKYVLGYDENMNIFLDFLGSHFYTYKQVRLQRSGIDTIKYHTWPRIPMGKWQTHRRHHKREPRGQPFPSRLFIKIKVQNWKMFWGR